jgi:hypothetical protein
MQSVDEMHKYDGEEGNSRTKSGQTLIEEMATRKLLTANNVKELRTFRQHYVQD